MQFEYKVVPAPRKGRAEKGVKGTEAKFANEMSHLMNEMGSEGWEYVRSDTLPCEERSGFTSKITVYQNLLVFRRAQGDIMTMPGAAPQPRRLADDAEILAIPAPTPNAGLLGVLRARKDARRDGTTTYSDIAAE
jgi:hypothetical protein